MNIVVYDCEIKRGIPARGEDRLPGIEYCKGWGDHAGMGVSVTGVHEHQTGRTRVFCDDNFGEMLHLFANADLLVGFNNIAFDDKLLEATYPGFEDITTPRYDLLVETWRAASLKPSRGSPKTHGGYGLDVMCKANWGTRKTGHSAMAPVHWQQGKIGTVIDYCLNDILMTTMFLNAAIRGDEIVNPKGGYLKMRDPLDAIVMGGEESIESNEAAKTGRFDASRENKSNVPKSEGHSVAANKLQWDDLMVEYESRHDFEADEQIYMVAVHGPDGLIVKRNLTLFEWSGYVAPLITDRDADGLIKYLREHEKTYDNIGDDSGTVK